MSKSYSDFCCSNPAPSSFNQLSRCSMLTCHSLESTNHREYQRISALVQVFTTKVSILVFRRKILDRSTDDFISNLSCDSSDGENCENLEVERQIFRRKLRELRNETNQSSTISQQQSAPNVSQQQAVHKQRSEQNAKSNVSQTNQSTSRKKGNWKFWF